MKPSEFGNCSYREAFLFANSYNKGKEEEFKNQIVLFEKVTDKVISMNAFAKKPKYISLIKDSYKELFKDELDELVKNGNITMMSQEEKIQICYGVTRRIKRRNRKEVMTYNS